MLKVSSHLLQAGGQLYGHSAVGLENLVESSWNVMAHGDARVGKWRGNWRMEWVASTLHTTSEHGVSSITTADAHTSAASSPLNWPPPPPATDLNGHVRFAERRNLVSVRVPSHFKRSLPDWPRNRCAPEGDWWQLRPPHTHTHRHTITKPYI